MITVKLRWRRHKWGRYSVKGHRDDNSWFLVREHVRENAFFVMFEFKKRVLEHVITALPRSFSG
jgi:hypothetical protein